MAMTYAQAKEAFMGIDAHFTTYVPASDIDAAAHIGDLVVITGIGEAGSGADAGIPLGVIDKYETDVISVQDRGYMEITYEHNADAAQEVTVGTWVETDGAGLGALSSSNKGMIAVAVDTTNHKAIVYKA